MARLEIHQFPCLSDNYGFLVHDADHDVTMCIDTPEVEPILRALEAKGGGSPIS
jgi:hydroxyacylglutathione hydrolase